VFAHGPTPFVSVLAAPAEEHQSEEHLPGPVQGCHHLGFGRGSGQDAAPGHGAAAKEDSVAPVALRGGAAAVSEVSRPEYSTASVYIPYKLISGSSRTYGTQSK